MPEPQRLDAVPNTIHVTSATFEQGGEIPRKCTCQGEDVSPSLLISGVPDDARYLALVVDDPDAPNGTFTHWLAWNLPKDTHEIGEGADVDTLGGDEGKNDFRETGYRGPCPPSGRHRYFFRVYALRDRLDVPRGARRRDVEDAIADTVVARGELMGTYEKA